MEQLSFDDRVRRNSSDSQNRRIDHRLKENISTYINADEEEITRRIRKLEQEWDIERYIEVNAPIFAGIGLILGILVSPYWFILSFAVLGFLALHAVQGWCPPVPLFRQFGVRTQQEIQLERQALKHLRGDFDGLDHPGEIPDIDILVNTVSCTHQDSKAREQL